MKRSMIIIVLVLLVGTGFAYAQTITYTGKPTNTDGTVFTVTATKEKNDANGGRTLVTKTRTIGGTGSHVDGIMNSADGTLISLEIYGFTKISSETTPSLKHVLSCSAADRVGISNQPDNPLPATYKQNLKSLILCSFNPAGIDNGTNGIGYLSMVATVNSTNSSDLPIKLNISSATVGGGIESQDENFIFKGTFKVTLKPQ